MRRINLPIIFDTLFTGLCAFLLFFTAIRFYTKSFAAALTFAIAAALLFGALAFLYIGGKQRHKLLISASEKKKRLLSLHLSLSSDEEVKKLMLCALGEGARASGKRITCGDKIYFLYFKMSPLSEDDAAMVIKSRTKLKKVIYCCKTGVGAADLCAHFGIEILTVENAYELLENGGLLPEKFVYEEPAKVRVLKRIKSRFSRKICAPLFWSGTALIALSYFTFFPIYYIVSGGLMLIAAAVALVIN